LKKLISMAAILAMVALMAAPALAQNFDFDNDDDNNFDNDDDNGFFFDNDDGNGFFFDNDNFDNGGGGGVSEEFEQETDETGDVTLDTSVSGSGDSSNQCVAPLQFGNTGNLQNEQGFLQYNSIADDVEFGGGTFEFAPEQAVQCDQAVQQSAASSS
jgi:hypothetical protein